MTIEDMIRYDKENKSELVLKYFDYLNVFRKLVDTDYALRSASNYNSSQLNAAEIGFAVTNIFHFYYILNEHLQASLCSDNRYRIYFCAESEYCREFEIYEYVDEETYKSVYRSISELNIEMPDT